MLEQYLNRNSLYAEIECYANCETFLKNFKPGKYQIVFMDIFMARNDLNGMQAAEKVHHVDQDAAIIFITNSPDYGIAGYKVAVYYILKPVDENELALAMEKCQTQIQHFAVTLQVISQRRTVSLRLRDVFYVEAQKHSCLFFTIDGSIRSNMVFERLCEQLSDLPFLRCHRSFTVNLSHVVALQANNIVMRNGQKIPIGRLYRNNVIRITDDWIKAEIRKK